MASIACLIQPYRAKATTATAATNLVNKDNLVAKVAKVAEVTGNLDDTAIAFEERAACLEFDGGLRRQDAEAIAANQIPEFLRTRRIAS